jgi:hypothetical protein
MDDETLTIASDKDLAAKLDTTGSSRVARRSEGRTTEQTEVAAARLFIPMLVSQGSLAYPLDLTFLDRPDLVIRWQSQEVGVEFTEAVPETYAKACVIRDRSYPGVYIDRQYFSFGRRASSREIHAYFQGKPDPTQSRGWSGDEVEVEPLECLEKILERKTKGLNRTDFTRLERNWLAVYISSTGPCFDNEVFLEKLQGVKWPEGNPVCFDELWILADSTFFRLRPSGDAGIIEGVSADWSRIAQGRGNPI